MFVKYKNINNEVLIFKNIDVSQSKRMWKPRRKIISCRTVNITEKTMVNFHHQLSFSEIINT